MNKKQFITLLTTVLLGLGSCAKEELTPTSVSGSTMPTEARIYDGDGLSISIEANMLDSIPADAMTTQEEGRALTYTGQPTATHFNFVRPAIPAGAMPVHMFFRNKQGDKFVYAQADFTSIPGSTRALDKFKITPPASNDGYKADKAQHNLKVIYSSIKGRETSYSSNDQVTVNSIDPDYQNEEWYVMGVYGGTWNDQNKVLEFRSQTARQHFRTNGLLNETRTLDVPYAFAWHKVDFIHEGRVMKLSQDTDTGDNVVTFKPQGTLLVVSLANMLNGEAKIKHIEISSTDFVGNVALDPKGTLSEEELLGGANFRMPWKPIKERGFLGSKYKRDNQMYISEYPTYTKINNGELEDAVNSGVIAPRVNYHDTDEQFRRRMLDGAFLLWGVPSQGFPQALANNSETPVKRETTSPKFTRVLVHHGYDKVEYTPYNEVIVFAQEHRPIKNGKTQELRGALYSEDVDGGALLIKNVFTKFVKGRNYTRIQLMNAGLFDADLRDYGIIRCYYEKAAKRYIPFGEPYTGNIQDYNTEFGFLYHARILPLMVLFEDADPFTQVFSQMKGEADGPARNAIKGGSNVTYHHSYKPIARIYDAPAPFSYINPNGPDDKYKLKMFHSVMVLSPAWHAEYWKATQPSSVASSFVSYLDHPSLKGESYDSFGYQETTLPSGKKVYTFPYLARTVAIDEGSQKMIGGNPGNQAKSNPQNLTYSVLDGGIEHHTLYQDGHPKHQWQRPALPDAYVLVKYSHARKRFVLWDTYVPLPFRDLRGVETQKFFEYFKSAPFFQDMFYKHWDLSTINLAYRIGYEAEHELDSRFPCLDIQKIKEADGKIHYARRFYPYDSYYNGDPDDRKESAVLKPKAAIEHWDNQRFPASVRDTWFTAPVRHR